MTKHLSRLRSTYLKNKALPIFIVAVIAIAGTLLLISSHAASPYVSTTADSGTLTSTASKVTSCSGSTDGSCVQFGTTSSGGTGGGGSGSTQTTNCFPSPGACGLPDPNYDWSASANAWAPWVSDSSGGGGGVGPTNAAGNQSVPCSSLPSSGPVSADTANATVQNMNITGGDNVGLDISANNVTVKNVCVSTNGGDNYDNSAPAISVEGTNDVIDNSTFGGANDTTQATQQAIYNPNGTVTLDHDYLHSCSECIHTGLTIEDSYVLTTSATVTGSYGTDHYENVYIWGATINANHDTMLNPMGETAVIFGDSGGGSCQNHVTLTNSLIAGGDYTLQPCSNQSPAGGGSMTITNNRIARCLSKNCPDSNGYFPAGGSYNYDTSGYINCSGANNKWSGNVWDDNSQTISC